MDNSLLMQHNLADNQQQLLQQQQQQQQQQQVQTLTNGGSSNTYDINNFEIPQQASTVKLNSKSFTINGERYMAGTFCLVRSDIPNQPPQVVLIHKPKLNNPQNYFQGIGLLRPENLTEKVSNYQFKPNELVVTKKQSTFPHNKVIDKCFVFTFEHALKGEPVGGEGKLKFYVNLEYVENKKLFKKIEDTKKFSPKENPRAFKPPMKQLNKGFPGAGLGVNNFKSPQAFGFGYDFNRAQVPQAPAVQNFIPPISQNLPKELKLKTKQKSEQEQIQQKAINSNEETKAHYQTICKTLGLIPESIRNEFPQNGHNEVVWYPTPPLNINFKSYRRALGPKHSLKYLKYMQAKKQSTTSTQ